jgi:hypothetical protein
MQRFYVGLRSYQHHWITIRQGLLSSLSSTTSFSVDVRVVNSKSQIDRKNGSSFHHLPMVLASYMMGWLYVNDMVSLSLSSPIIRQNIKHSMGILRTLYCSSITRQAISLLKWCRSLHYLYIEMPWYKQDSSPIHNTPQIQAELTNEVTTSIILSYRNTCSCIFIFDV